MGRSAAADFAKEAEGVAAHF